MIEAGKTYPLRGGLTARIGFTDKKGNRPISGLVDVGEREDHQTWFRNGRMHEKIESDYDIIMPEPERETRWLNWYVESAYTSRGAADHFALENRTHVFEIITENGEPVDVKIHKVTK